MVFDHIIIEGKKFTVEDTDNLKELNRTLAALLMKSQLLVRVTIISLTVTRREQLEK